MGTNFYLYPYPYEDDDSPKYHIGKRSAAGWYCWDCQITLCKGGKEQIHSGFSGMYEKCPQCGQKQIMDSYSPVEIELGFKKPSKPIKKSGVRGISSFTWAMEAKILDGLGSKKLPIVDEYGRRYSLEFFKEFVLGNCPIQYFKSIGRRFS